MESLKSMGSGEPWTPNKEPELMSNTLMGVDFALHRYQKHVRNASRNIDLKKQVLLV